MDIKCKFVSPVVKIPNLQFNVLSKIDPKSSYHFVPVIITNENTALKFYSLIGCSEGLVDMVNSKSLKMPIRIRKSKNRQHNGQKKNGKRITNDLQNIHIKVKIG